MASDYEITLTNGSSLISSLLPLQLNGPGDEANAAADIHFFGMGYPLWGEKIQENAVRALENFACAESIGMPGFPQTSAELGAGNGVNNPIEGQLWYNTTQQTIHVFDGAAWNALIDSTGGVATGPIETTGGIITNTNSGVVADISMAGDGLITAEQSLTMLFDSNDDSTSSLFNIGHNAGVGGGTVDMLFQILDSGIIRASTTANTYASLVSDDRDVPNKKYVDDALSAIDLSEYIKHDGSVLMSGDLNLNSHKITGVSTPTSNTDATNKVYVDDLISGIDLSGYIEAAGDTMTGLLTSSDRILIHTGASTSTFGSLNSLVIDTGGHFVGGGGDSGLTIRSFEPNVTFIDRSYNTDNFQIVNDANSLAFNVDTDDDYVYESEIMSVDSTGLNIAKRAFVYGTPASPSASELLPQSSIVNLMDNRVKYVHDAPSAPLAIQTGVGATNGQHVFGAIYMPTFGVPLDVCINGALNIMLLIDGWRHTNVEVRVGNGVGVPPSFHKSAVVASAGAQTYKEVTTCITKANQFGYLHYWIDCDSTVTIFDAEVEFQLHGYFK